MYELGTIAVNKVALKILVMKNGYLGLVREHQEKVFGSRYSGVQLYDYPYYDKIAAAYDMGYFRCSSNEALPDQLEAFLHYDGAAIMVCDIDASNNVI